MSRVLEERFAAVQFFFVSVMPSDCLGCTHDSAPAKGGRFRAKQEPGQRPTVNHVGKPMRSSGNERSACATARDSRHHDPHPAGILLRPTSCSTLAESKGGHDEPREPMAALV
jgi:hypothetical protein